MSDLCVEFRPRNLTQVQDLFPSNLANIAEASIFTVINFDVVAIVHSFFDPLDACQSIKLLPSLLKNCLELLGELSAH